MLSSGARTRGRRLPEMIATYDARSLVVWLRSGSSNRRAPCTSITIPQKDKLAKISCALFCSRLDVLLLCCEDMTMRLYQVTAKRQLLLLKVIRHDEKVCWFCVNQEWWSLLITSSHLPCDLLLNAQPSMYPSAFAFFRSYRTIN
jgi:hypothetical protein